eukprot:scaffold5359_cov112-Skeletonema_marinoi.AAC.8
MFSFGSYYLGDYDGFGGPDRRCWADKSEAALRRERTADGKFDDFLKKCSALDMNDKSIFPLTEEVVDASTHLTEACWKTFRKRVENKGCKAKRRQATLEERVASGDHRKGKLYVISITCPVHPSKAKDEKLKKEAAAAAKKKKAEEAAEHKARLAAMHKEKVSETYAKIVGEEHDDSNTQHKTPGKAKAATMDSFVNVKVTSADLLQHAMTVHNKRQTEIRLANQSEERKLMSELMKKLEEEKQELRRKMKSNESKLIEGAKAEYEEVKGKIEEACADKTATVTPSASAKKIKK